MGGHGEDFLDIVTYFLNTYQTTDPFQNQCIVKILVCIIAVSWPYRASGIVHLPTRAVQVFYTNDSSAAVPATRERQ